MTFSPLQACGLVAFAFVFWFLGKWVFWKAVDRLNTLPVSNQVVDLDVGPSLESRLCSLEESSGKRHEQFTSMLASWQKRQDERHEELMGLLRKAAADQAGILSSTERHLREAFGGRGYSVVDDGEAQVMEEVKRFKETYGVDQREAMDHVRSKLGRMGGRA